MNTDARLTAKLLSACPPDSAQKEKLEDVLSKKYGKAVELVWQEDRTAQGGFRIELGSEVIDWTAEGRLEQLKERLTGLKSEGSVIPLIRDAVKSWVPEVCAREVGSVLTVADGIAYVEGLEGATYGEILLFEGGIRGMVQELRSGRIGCILFGRVEEVSEGTAVYRTGKTAGIGVSDGMIGRVVDALGAPIDGGGDIRVDEYRMIESPAPGIIDRQPVNTPMQTGILSIDSMFPIGRGQRELIIGDRQTGKTAIAIDTILNQKGKDIDLHLRGHRPEGQLRGADRRAAAEARRHALHHRRVRRRGRVRVHAVHRALCRRGHRRIFHEQGQGRADRVRRSE